jgi:hypothetical protein
VISCVSDHVPIASYDDTPSSSSSGGLLPPGVHLLHLDWSSPSRSGVLARCRPDVIVACDTIYLPELHQDQGTVVREGMKMGQAAATATVTAAAGSFSTASSSSSARYPCAYFAQMNRNPETFVHYLQTFRELGLHVESQTEEAAVSTPKRFAYDRQAIEFHRFTLPQALADA